MEWRPPLRRPPTSTSCGAAHLFAEAATRWHELDPEVLIAYRRVVALDRAWRSVQGLGANMARSLAAYRQADHLGALLGAKPIPSGVAG